MSLKEPRSYFERYLVSIGDKALTKWGHYFNVYQREFGPFLNRPISFLEIGVFRGGSIPMWRGYFDEGSRVTFIDIDPACKAHEIEGTTVEIGNQADPEFLARVAESHGPFDLILDDGSHICEHQIASYQALWPHLSDRGLYVVEDVHTSYWPGYGGGYRDERSFVEFAKGLVDVMHSWYTDQDDIFPFDEAAKELEGVRFYDSMVVLEKRLRKYPPLSIHAKNGRITGSRKALSIRGRGSIFTGKDGYDPSK